jgi:hypothetical protein
MDKKPNYIDDDKTMVLPPKEEEGQVDDPLKRSLTGLTFMSEVSLARPALGSAAILVVDPVIDDRDFVARALRAYDVTRAETIEIARRKLLERPFDIVITAYELGAEVTGVDFLRHCAVEQPAARRLIMASYDDLRTLVQLRATELVYQVVPKPLLRQGNVRRVVEEALFGGTASQLPDVLTRTEAAHLLKWTIRDIVKIKGIVIRPMSPNQGDLQLQFIIPDDYQLEGLLAQLCMLWRRPLKARDAPLSLVDQDHPVVASLGGLDVNQELYVRRLSSDAEAAHVYAAILPWRRDAKLTLVLGFEGAASLATYRALLDELHKKAIEEVPSYALPRVRDSLDKAQYAAEYDWVVTEEYVGPDRRARATTFLNKHVLVGNRTELPEGLSSERGAFFDRVQTPARWLMFMYVFLSLIDTVCTYVFVREKLVVETNPLMRFFVFDHPVAFVLVKNVLSISAIVLVVRFERFRFGLHALSLNVAVYFVLNIYWAILLLRAARACLPSS